MPTDDEPPVRRRAGPIYDDAVKILADDDAFRRRCSPSPSAAPPNGSNVELAARTMKVKLLARTLGPGGVVRHRIDAVPAKASAELSAGLIKRAAERDLRGPLNG